MKGKIVIWGASGHAAVVADIIRMRGEYELAGFLDNVNPERHGTAFYQSIILGGEDQLEMLREQGVHHIILGFGKNEARLRISKLVRTRGFQLPTAIHPHAVISENARIAAGTVIKAGAVIDPLVSIGENVIISSCVSVGHGSSLANGVQLSSGSSLAGGVVIGEGSWIGTGASLKNRITIGKNSIIGAGSVVVHDIPDGVVAYGVPARVVRPVRPEEL